MARKTTIDFDGIYGITPDGSTYADLLRELGDNFRIERQESFNPATGKQWRTVFTLRFPRKNVAVIFFGHEKLRPTSRVKIVSAESGCRLRTPTGLYVGMSKANALSIIEKNYRVRHLGGDGNLQGWFVVPIAGKTRTDLCLYFQDDCLNSIEVYRHRRNYKLLR